MWMRSVRWSTLKKAGMLLAVIAAGGAVLLWPRAVTTGISRGLTVCGGVLIPGLLPFLVLAGFLVRSGLCEAIGRRLERPVRWLFHLPGCCGAAILIGLCGGYPAGGAAVAELYRSGCIDVRQGRRMLHFCVNAGPAFVISTVGAGLLGSVKAGVILYAAHIAAALLIGIGDGLLERWDGKQKPALPPKAVTPVQKDSSAAAFVGAVNAACSSLLSMCGFVMLAAALLAVFDAVGITKHPLLAVLLPGLLEVSCGCVEAAGSPAMPLLLGTIMGWGGLSVHGQLAAALSGTGLMAKGFFAARLLQALLSGVLSAVLFRVLPASVTAMAPLSASPLPTLSGSVTAGSALLFMCGLFLLGTGKQKTS